MKLDLRKIADHARTATTEDLLDRVTLYRNDMEPVALDLFEGELDRRGVSRTDIADHHAQRQATTLFNAAGRPVACGFCGRPAVFRGWYWYRLFGWIPILPRILPACEIHGRE